MTPPAVTIASTYRQAILFINWKPNLIVGKFFMHLLCYLEDETDCSSGFDGTFFLFQYFTYVFSLRRL